MRQRENERERQREGERERERETETEKKRERERERKRETERQSLEEKMDGNITKSVQDEFCNKIHQIVMIVEECSLRTFHSVKLCNGCSVYCIKSIRRHDIIP